MYLLDLKKKNAMNLKIFLNSVSKTFKKPILNYS